MESVSPPLESGLALLCGLPQDMADMTLCQFLVQVQEALNASALGFGTLASHQGKKPELAVGG